jgi:superfamily II DNA or RNA helicase
VRTFFTHRSVSTFDRVRFQLTDECSCLYGIALSSGEGAPKANASQKNAVCALSAALEKIQGPPGTGKSTTIYHVVTQRVPKGERVLVTCSRNVAVESIAQKLKGAFSLHWSPYDRVRVVNADP